MADDGLLSSLRYLFADFLGEDDDTPPFLPDGLPETIAPAVGDAIDLLIDYQSATYARLYVDRLRRFVGRRGVDEALLADIALLMARRMAYQDPIRIAQLKLAESGVASSAFSSEAETGSRQENASNQESGAPFRFRRNGKGSSAFPSEVETGSRQENASNQESRAPFRSHRNGKGSSRAQVQSADDVRRFRLDELIGALPAAVAEYVLDALEWAGWARRSISIRFSTTSRWGIRRLKMEAALRRWRLFSVRYAEERAWVERWLHMIDRSLTKQPKATPAIVQTATMIQSHGDVYRQGIADWHTIIDGLVKPTFDGVLVLSDLAGAIVEARAAAMPDPRQAALKRKIAEIRARLPAEGASAG